MTAPIAEVEVTAEHIAAAHGLAYRCPAGACHSPARYHQESCLRIARAFAEREATVRREEREACRAICLRMSDALREQADKLRNAGNPLQVMLRHRADTALGLAGTIRAMGKP